MPTPIEYLDAQVDAEYRVSISWNLKAKLSDLPPEGIKFEADKSASVPLRGDWYFQLENEDNQLEMMAAHGILAYAAHGERVTVTCEFAYIADGALRQIGTTSWGTPTPKPELDEDDGLVYAAYIFSLAKGQLAADGKLPQAVQSSIQQYRFTVTLTQEPEGDVARLHQTPMSDLTKALQLAKLSHSPNMDVRLIFKHADDLVLELWTAADFLGEASDYYKSLFASAGTETVTRSRSKRQRGPSVVSEQKPFAPGKSPDPKVDWEDSDDGTDAFLVERDLMNCTKTKQETAEINYQQIEVVLERKAALVATLKEHPTLPPPVSPKSVYRLAHLLEREELQKLALDAFASNLTISGAADELFSPVLLAYDKLRKIVVAFVVKNWKEVRATETWRAAQGKVVSAPTEGGAQILCELLSGVSDAWGVL